MWQEGDKIRPTGIPPHISILAKLDKVEHRMEGLDDQLRQLAPTLVPAITTSLQDVVEKCTLRGATVTPTLLKESVQASVQQAINGTGLLDLLAALRSVPAAPVAATAASASASVSAADIAASWYQLFQWPDQTMHLVPADYVLPRGPTLMAWQHYCFGDVAHDIPPRRPTARKRRQAQVACAQTSCANDAVWSEKMR